MIGEHYEFFGVFFTFTHHLYSFVSLFIFFLFLFNEWNFIFSLSAESKNILLPFILECIPCITKSFWLGLPKRWSNSICFISNDEYNEDNLRSLFYNNQHFMTVLSHIWNKIWKPLLENNQLRIICYIYIYEWINMYL